MYDDSCCVVRVKDDKEDAIGKIDNTMKSVPKEINVMSTTMGEIGKNLHNVEKNLNLMQINPIVSINELR